MGYAVKEIVYTLQGEGGQTGRAAVFCRFSGCNLWSGFERDRAVGKGGCARWCDTNFVGTDGPNGGKFALPSALADKIESQWLGGAEQRLVVCTGGEPLLQLDEALIDELHRRHFTVAVETNGTQDPPKGLDWDLREPEGADRTEVEVRHRAQDGSTPRTNSSPSSLSRSTSSTSSCNRRTTGTRKPISRRSWITA